MKIILLKNHPKLGDKFDVREVKEGYARNFLIPNKIAIFADKASLDQLSILKKRELGEQKSQQDNLVEVFKRLKETKIRICAKTNKGGSLFASVNKDIIRNAISQNKIELPNDCQIILRAPIKKIGKYEVEIVVKNKKLLLPVEVVGTE